MPQKKKISHGPISREALRKRQKRSEETEETRQARLLANRLRNSAARQCETEDERQARLLAKREQNVAVRQCETAEQRQARLLANRIRNAAARQCETEEMRQARLLANRMRNAVARQCETEEERQARLLAKRTKTAAARQRETPEEHQARLFAERLKKRQRRQQINERQQNTMTHPMQMQVQHHFPVDAPPAQMQMPSSLKKTVLRVDNHQHNMMSNLASLWRYRKFCDASIGNGKATVKVHKLVLYAVCPKLVSLSKSDIESHEFLQVNLPDKVSWEALNAFAEYMYNGILDLDCNILQQLKIIADRLDMKEFEELCDSYLPNYMHQPVAYTVATDIPLNHLSRQFPSMMSSLPSLSSTISAPIQSAASITTQVIDVKQEISERELVQVRKDTAAMFGQESEVASLTPNKSGNADGFVICPSIKTESVGSENDKYGYPSINSNSQTFTVTSSSSSLTAAASTSNTSVPASQTEYAIPFSETKDVKSTKLKASHSYESTFVSDLSPVPCIKECSQSSYRTETISKPLNQLSNSSSVNLPTTSDKSVYPVKLFKSEADNLPP